jgi:uncharacterized paraquat-inducible protein A
VSDAVVVWCEECQADVEDEHLTDEGACPRCGTLLRSERRPVPWTFKVMLVATVIYLGYRAYQGIGWLVHHV